jgi:tRNA/tmRNA/rRNA uracil-C5-methylase (TrmA/RlmC/RlmD family)
MTMEVELDIRDVAFGGAGVARHEGKVFFVPFTAPGDRVRARVTRDKKKFAEARVIEIVRASPGRIEAKCKYFGTCGGCAYQHIAYERQLSLKQAQVEQTLRRVGRLAEVPMRPIIPSPQPFSFRNRVRVHVIGGQAGFFAHGSHDLVSIDHCAIARPEVNEALAGLRRSAAPDGDYTLTAGKGGEFFEQTNDAVAAELLALVTRSITPGRALLVDAYCGAGFFARQLTGLAEQVVGIEENEHAVAYAKRNATSNERYIAGDVAALLGDVLAHHDMERTTIVLDPPATGLAPRALDILRAALPSELVYVSCNPATLARDLGILAGSWGLESVTPLDMFPQTAEIEVAAVLRRRL